MINTDFQFIPSAKLREARALYAKSRTIEAYARDAAGESCPALYHSAVSFCAIGACSKVTGLAPSAVIYQVCDVIGINLIGESDTSLGHGLAAFDQLIAETERIEALGEVQ